MDIIEIKGLNVLALIGVYDFERHAKQRLTIDVQMYVDLSKAGASDDINDTVHYGNVAELLENIADNSEFALLEALATEMIRQIFVQFKPAKIDLTVHKPDILKQADNVAIRMMRENPNVT